MRGRVVSKVWGSFSILVVLAMLLFLVPAAVLLGPPPVTPVVQGQPQNNVTEEWTGNITLTENTSGAYAAFTVSSTGSPDTLEQYTRAYVLRTAQLPAQFRHITNLTGNTTGSIPGSLIMRGHRYSFNMTYNYTPIYMSGTAFGIMMGNGEFFGSDSLKSNFSFQYGFDYDCNNNTSIFAGKGFLVSYNETGNFSGHNIVGEFYLNRSGNTYTGTYSLRNYYPNDILYQGWINTTGRINTATQETLPNPSRCATFNITQANLTGNKRSQSVTSGAGAPQFDNQYWGWDLAKSVNRSPSWIGQNGSVEGTWNGVLTAGTSGILGWAACGETLQWLRINDTYAKTGNDGTLHGIIYNLMGINIPHQTMWNPVTEDGLSFCSFGMYYQSTEDYAGTESYGLTTLSITMAASPPYNMYSNSSSWALLPFPRPLSCTPPNGNKSTTMNVTIPGRYFFRAASAENGTLSFGQGITVNAYTVSGTDLNGTIEANITILANAAAGPRTINVTSCFKNQTASNYRSGELVNGFEVLGAGTSAITGTVYEANTSLIPSATVTLMYSSNNTTVANTTTNASGYYNFTVNKSNTYNINVSKSGFFSPVQKQVIVTLPNPVSCNFTGMDAPYRTAPDGYYCTKCSNEWLMGAFYSAEFRLNGTRVSDVLYAWTHPS